MADAKITIQTLVDNKELQTLNKEFAEGSQKLKKLQGDLKNAEKEFGVTSEEAKKLRSELEMQRVVNKSLLKDMSKTTNELTRQAKAMDNASQSSGRFSSFTKQFGVDLDSIIGKLGSTTGLIAGLASTAIAAGSALVNSARDVSALSNQFMVFAGNAKDAEKMYSLFNDVYRNTNYDEQKVMDMAKGLMRIGVNAKDAASLIEKCSDAAAGVGKGADYAEELAKTLAKVKIGGELTEKQLQQLAQSGIDLNDVQEDIRAGGERAYNALIDKLGQFEGSMQKAKGTAAEMEGDIKGNCVQIGRELALLVDDIFDFSGKLKTFYQWVIDVSQKVIDKIREMRKVFAASVASANAYAKGMEGVVVPGDDASQEELIAYQQKVSAANKMADAAKAEAMAREESTAALEKQSTVIRTITGGAVSHGGSTASGSSKVSAKATATTESAVESGPLGIFSNENLENMSVGVEGFKTLRETVQAMADEDYIGYLNGQLDKNTQYLISCADAARNYQVSVGQDLGTTFAEIITGSKSAGEAMKAFAKNLIQSAIQMLAQWAAIYAIVCMFSGPKAASDAATKAVFGVSKFANGGFVSGPGGPRSDSVPAMLSNGEYVLNARAVDAIGVDNLNRMNYGATNPAEGMSAIGGGSVTLNVSAIDASGFSDFLAKGGLDGIKQALFEDNRMFASDVGVW